jgi:superfamily II DNA or RNA helicase
MSYLKDFPFKPNYDSYEDNPIEDFFLPALKVSNKYQRASGFFSAALMGVVPEAFTDFAERGGKIELICSPILSVQDAGVFELIAKERIFGELNQSINNLESDGLLTKPLDLMAALIRHGCLSVKFAIPHDAGSGIFHQKIGVFSDQGRNSVAFSGSNNESVSGWMELRNSESFSVFNSWRDENDFERSQDIQKRIDRMWRNNYKGFEIVEFENSLDFIDRRSQEDSDLANIKGSVREWYEERKKERTKSTSTFSLRGYQNDVIKDWENKGFKGIVSFATGAGKTITALAAIDKWRKLSNKNAVLILVPSIRLQKQWIDEISKFPGNENLQVLAAGGDIGSDIWQLGLRDQTSEREHLEDGVVVAVNATASRDAFISRISWGSHLLLVADEVHNVGASGFGNLLESINCGAILGLSATPERYNDDENTIVRGTFGEDLKPIVDIPYAQELGVLVQYRYRYQTVRLSDEELEQHQKLTKMIGMESSKTEKGESSSRLEMLRFQRANILKNAGEKIVAAEEIIRRDYKQGDSWIIFCNDSNQLDALFEKIKDLNPLTYHQNMEGGQDETLQYFAKNGGIILSILMLDEGVDIPSVDHCILIASSESKRQYIQRRGRVLRVNKQTPKGVAEIWDLIVVDENNVAFTPAEIVRATEFARMAINHSINIDLEKLIP